MAFNERLHVYKDSGELGFLHCSYHADELCLCLIVVFHVILKFVHEYLLYLRSLNHFAAE